MARGETGGSRSLLYNRNCSSEFIFLEMDFEEFFVKNNFEELSKHGIKLDCAYLDVFTCNEGDECANPLHRMTRRDCYEYRGRCFEYLLKMAFCQVLKK